MKRVKTLRRIAMITKAYLEQIVASWPDNEGHSSNPEVYDAWIERERRYNARVIQNALGVDRILSLSAKQKTLLENSYAELLTRKDITEISDNEIIGRFELITEYMSSRATEFAVDAYKQRRKLN